ncbi:hypothetical protein [Propionivibrio sp.]|uniref:hypothetical protein n=1 Tax=Propionivibrio sp. TaxID=2212460 RepID=UPI003BF21BDA
MNLNLWPQNDIWNLKPVAGTGSAAAIQHLAGRKPGFSFRASAAQKTEFALLNHHWQKTKAEKIVQVTFRFGLAKWHFQ